MTQAAVEKDRESVPSGKGSKIRVVAERQVTETKQTTLPNLDIPPAPSERAELLAAHAMPPISPPQPSSKETEAKNLAASWHVFQATLGILVAISMILATRFLLLAGAAGAFALTVMVLQNPTWTALSVTALYDVTVVLPLVWLYLKKG